MTSTNPPLPDPNPAIGTAPGPVDQAQRSVQTLPIKFTGTGSEYFRIWIVNLLLILVTLSFYKPWAKARTLRYFSGNTLIDGHPLAFHGDAKKMFRGYLLVGAMVLLYLVAGNISPVAGVVALVILVLVWPALLKSSMQFRLANTSWRGLRFRFTGSLGQAYAAVLPLLVPGAIFLGAAGLLDPEGQQPPVWLEALMLSVLLFMLIAVPWLWCRLKGYQHNHYAYAGLQTQFRATARSF